MYFGDVTRRTVESESPCSAEQHFTEFGRQNDFDLVFGRNGTITGNSSTNVGQGKKEDNSITLFLV